MATILTDTQINARTRRPASHQMTVQGGRYLPIVVDLTVANITIGRAILEALNADLVLAAAYLGEAVTDALTLEQENKALDQITFVAFEGVLADITIRAYLGASTHVSTAVAGEITYKPVAEMYRNYASSANAATTIGVGVD